MSAKFLTFLILVFFSNYCYSQTCCSGGIPITNNIGLPMLEKGGFQVGVFYDYNRLRTLKEGSVALNDNSRLRTTNSVLLNIGYNITNTLSLETLFTWVNQKRLISQFGNKNLDETQGIGDGVVFVRYKALQKEQEEVIVSVGGKIPFGATDKENDLGVLLNADLQPGSNSFDYLFGTTYMRRLSYRKSMVFTSRVLYKLTGTNSSYQRVNEYKFGNEIQLSLGISDQFLLFKEIIRADLLFKYRNLDNDKINSNIIDSTGGQWVFVIPSINYQISPTISLISKVEIPLYSKVNGTQLTPTYRINVGVLVRVFKKKTIKL